MLIGGDDIGNDVITLDACFRVFFNACLASCAFLLCAYLQALLPFSALLPECPGEIACMLLQMLLGEVHNFNGI